MGIVPSAGKPTTLQARVPPIVSCQDGLLFGCSLCSLLGQMLLEHLTGLGG